uniref:Uncharacterized protein n=1 Tax=Dicentrarchus labrax TaxID=13489 RepID=A0A8P4FZ36_DICLA
MPCGQRVNSDVMLPCFCKRFLSFRPASAMLASLQIKRGIYKHKKFTLESPAGAIMKIGDLEDTIYRGKHDEVNGWGKFFLPEIVRMQVVGVVKGTSCPCDQLVLMTCEDRKMYAYDGEELHEVASSFEQLCAEGIEYPASRSYYEGEAFKHMDIINNIKGKTSTEIILINLFCEPQIGNWYSYWPAIIILNPSNTLNKHIIPLWYSNV